MGNCFSNDTKSMRSEILKKDKLDIIKQKTSASRYHQESEKTTHNMGKIFANQANIHSNHLLQHNN